MAIAVLPVPGWPAISTALPAIFPSYQYKSATISQYMKQQWLLIFYEAYFKTFDNYYQISVLAVLFII